MNFIPEQDESEDLDQGGAVYPCKSCTHLEASLHCSRLRDIISALPLNLGTPCSACDSTAENWICLSCGDIKCSRYVAGHAEQHWLEAMDQKDSHCIALSLSDLNVWCYACGSYIKHDSLVPILVLCESIKFSTEPKTKLLPPATSGRAAIVLPSNDMDEHLSETPCDERPLRTDAIMNQLNSSSSSVLCSLVSISAVLSEESYETALAALHAVHSKAYIQSIRTASASAATVARRADAFFTESSFTAALQAAGAGLSILDRIFAPVPASVDHLSIERGFVLVRPPGHHAGPTSGAGYCIFNNAAVSAQYCLQKYPEVRRVLIVDLDIHHGNGTQECFYSRQDVCTLSIHRQTYVLDGEEVEFPEVGRANYIGVGPGLGFNINVPLGEVGSDDDYYYIFNEVVLPVAERYRPDLIIVATGFDASIYDFAKPQGGYRLSTSCYEMLITSLLKRVNRGRVLCTLEGGYDPYGLGINVEAVLQVLTTYDPDANSGDIALPVRTDKVDEKTLSVVQEVKEEFRKQNCNIWFGA